MKEGMWGVYTMIVGILGIVVLSIFITITLTNEQDYYLLKETTEAAMIDAIDIGEYRSSGTIKIIEEKFTENFIRRFASNVNLPKKYRIEILDVNETPPKVSIRVKSEIATLGGGVFGITNNLDAILEADMKYTPVIDVGPEDPCKGVPNGPYGDDNEPEEPENKCSELFEITSEEYGKEVIFKIKVKKKIVMLKHCIDNENKCEPDKIVSSPDTNTTVEYDKAVYFRAKAQDENGNWCTRKRRNSRLYSYKIFTNRSSKKNNRFVF